MEPWPLLFTSSFCFSTGCTLSPNQIWICHLTSRHQLRNLDFIRAKGSRAFVFWIKHTVTIIERFDLSEFSTIRLVGYNLHLSSIPTREGLLQQERHCRILEGLKFCYMKVLFLWPIPISIPEDRRWENALLLISFALWSSYSVATLTRGHPPLMMGTPPNLVSCRAIMELYLTSVTQVVGLMFPCETSPCSCSGKAQYGTGLQMMGQKMLPSQN